MQVDHGLGVSCPQVHPNQKLYVSTRLQGDSNRVPQEGQPTA
jgi:hypothetical protein